MTDADLVYWGGKRRVALKRDLNALAKRDEHVAAALKALGHPPPRVREPGCATLLRAVVAQQVSTAAAASIWKRLEAHANFDDPVAVAKIAEADLRAAGLSRQKIAYTLHIADTLACGRVDLAKVHAMPDDEAIDALVTLKGIGRWSAEIYLLFALQRRDVFPAGDLALQIGMQRLKGLRRRPDPQQLTRRVEAWRPYRGAGAHLLWHVYAAAKRGEWSAL